MNSYLTNYTELFFSLRQLKREFKKKLVPLQNDT